VSKVAGENIAVGKEDSCHVGLEGRAGATLPPSAPATLQRRPKVDRKEEEEQNRLRGTATDAPQVAEDSTTAGNEKSH
jgi:hypothetical protein